MAIDWEGREGSFVTHFMITFIIYSADATGPKSYSSIIVNILVYWAFYGRT